jgi:two-component system, OmpR family, sensor kinase
VTSTEVARDARVVREELMRLRRQATRMPLLASAGSPGFLKLTPLSAAGVVEEALERWGHTLRQWRLGTADGVPVLGDGDRLALAVDALLENAIAHTAAGDRIEVSARRENGHVVLVVADSGEGIPAGEVERIFERFRRAGPPRSRDGGGFGFGPAIVQAIAEAHHGSVRARSAAGSGEVVEILLRAESAASPVTWAAAVSFAQAERP